MLIYIENLNANLIYKLYKKNTVMQLFPKLFQHPIPFEEHTRGLSFIFGNSCKSSAYFCIPQSLL